MAWPKGPDDFEDETFFHYCWHAINDTWDYEEENEITQEEMEGIINFEYPNPASYPPGEIVDMPEISACTDLERLDIDRHSVAEINVSNNTALEFLRVERNNLTALDVSANTSLTELNARANDITEIDITDLSDLEDLNIASNDLTTLDISENLSLWNVSIAFNDISSITTADPQTSVTHFRASSNDFSSIDVSLFPNLEALFLNNNSLSSLDLSGLSSLERIEVNDNGMTDLQLSTPLSSQYPDLRVFMSEGNSLSTSGLPDFNNHPSLWSVYIDDTTFSGTLDFSDSPKFSRLRFRDNANVEKIKANDTALEKDPDYYQTIFQFFNNPNLEEVEMRDSFTIDDAEGVCTFAITNWTTDGSIECVDLNGGEYLDSISIDNVSTDDFAVDLRGFNTVKYVRIANNDELTGDHIEPFEFDSLGPSYVGFYEALQLDRNALEHLDFVFDEKGETHFGYESGDVVLDVLMNYIPFDYRRQHTVKSRDMSDDEDWCWQEQFHTAFGYSRIYFKTVWEESEPLPGVEVDIDGITEWPPSLTITEDEHDAGISIYCQKYKGWTVFEGLTEGEYDYGVTLDGWELVGDVWGLKIGEGDGSATEFVLSDEIPDEGDRAEYLPAVEESVAAYVNGAEVSIDSVTATEDDLTVALDEAPADTTEVTVSYRRTVEVEEGEEYEVTVLLREIEEVPLSGSIDVLTALQLGVVSVEFRVFAKQDGTWQPAQVFAKQDGSWQGAAVSAKDNGEWIQIQTHDAGGGESE